MRITFKEILSLLRIFVLNVFFCIKMLGWTIYYLMPLILWIVGCRVGNIPEDVMKIGCIIMMFAELFWILLVADLQNKIREKKRKRINSLNK
ncbi:MAG TPA: hypothetical protein PLB74_00760 [Candidatus Paceibacterota bacterium]|nr:hypothetical protein [Candidatus Paceibacterota bacterium]HOL53997.1 hypothetical protein [Candidatus Paceibacterota bacterium]HOV88581.1 hypothetical protein [Candidatus Paceibacterota bacterium]HPP17082.1 hypothetical protein [Candidatus Paceibacterota bacterium]